MEAAMKSAAQRGQGPAARVLVVVDITGSMGSELNGVKETVEAFVKLLSDEHYEIAISTYTESKRGCYVSLRTFHSIEDAVTHVRDIKLCRPPDDPEIEASGGDGPENLKAALHALVDLQPMPTIGFVITDAPPHMAGDRGPESAQELQHLAARGVAQVRGSKSPRFAFQRLFSVENTSYQLLLAVSYGERSYRCPDARASTDTMSLPCSWLIRPSYATRDVY